MFRMTYNIRPTRGQIQSTRRQPGHAKARPYTPFLELLEGRVVPSTFLVTNTKDSGSGSLRHAIVDANTKPGLDTIAFAIDPGGVRTIAPLSPLPALTDPVIIDGTTQPGYAESPLIELTGGQAGSGAHGLRILGGNSTIRGLVINGFALRGLQLENAGGNRITGNYVGTDVTGTQVRSNGSGGIVIMANSNDNVIGGTVAADRNLTSGNQPSKHDHL